MITPASVVGWWAWRRCDDAVVGSTWPMRENIDVAMTNAFDFSVRAIRAALEEIPGTILDEPPQFENVGAGVDPATAVWTYDAGTTPGFETLDAPSNDKPDLGIAEVPSVIFEVPPAVTNSDIERVLGEDRIRELLGLQRIRGLDALGWYVTFHQRKVQHGIYIPLEGMLWLAVNGLGAVHLSVERRVELAFHAILRHELFHFEADCMAANWELATGVDVYWKARGHRNNAGYIELEEALANAYMLRGFKHPPRRLANSGGAYGMLRRYCEQQPEGYRDGPLHAASRRRYLEECRYLSGMFHEVSGASWEAPHAFDTLLLYPNPTLVDWTRCPIIVTDAHDLQRLLGIRVSHFSAVTAIEETAAFRKKLNKADTKIQRLWATRKEQLARSTSLSSLDFKQWKVGGPDCYSVRIDGNYRVHLRHERGSSRWFAIAIGDHRNMGHG